MTRRRPAGPRAVARGRVTVLPHRNDWTETQRDAIEVIERYIASRGFHRRGNVLIVPLTVGHVRFWLRRLGARRSGRDYAREVLAELVRIGVLEDTGSVMKPCRQPSRHRSYWWRLWRVIPALKAQTHYTPLDRRLPTHKPHRQGGFPASSLSVSIPTASRGDSAAETAPACSPGFRSVGVPTFRPAMTGVSSPREYQSVHRLGVSFARESCSHRGGGRPVTADTGAGTAVRPCRAPGMCAGRGTSRCSRAESKPEHR